MPRSRYIVGPSCHEHLSSENYNGPSPHQDLRRIIPTKTRVVRRGVAHYVVCHSAVSDKRGPGTAIIKTLLALARIDGTIYYYQILHLGDVRHTRNVASSRLTI